MSYSGQAVFARKTTRVSRFPGAAAGRNMAGKDQNDDCLSALDTLGSVCSFERNQTIFSEGEELQSSYKIVSGAVRLSRITEDGRRQIAEFRVAGDFIGLEWDGQYALTAEAVREVVAVRYVRTRVDRLMEQRCDVRDRVVSLIRKELRAAHEHVITLGCQSAKERVATFLLQLARRAGASDGETIEIELGRQDIADYLGLTVETVSRTLSEFQRVGAISLPKRRQIVICSKAKLRAQTISIN